MGYLPDFKYDIFLSYAHVDNSTVSEFEKGWVFRFYELLKLQVDKRVGRGGIAAIWWDDKLRANQLFDEEIKAVISQSALFITFTSNGYYGSDYCINELNWFYDSAKKSKLGLSINNFYRIANIQLYNITYPKWPPECRGAGCYKMFRLDSGDENGLGNPFDTDSKRFKKMIEEVAEDIYKLLVLIKSANDPSPSVAPANVPEPKSKTKVYFARASDTLSNEKKQVIHELEAKNIEVIKRSIPPPYPRSEHFAEMQKIIQEAGLSVHLFDQMPGDEIEAGSSTFSQEQLNIARKSSKEQLIFIPKELEIEKIEDHTHRKFLLDLQQLKKDDDKYSLIRESAPPNITREIFERIQQMETKPTRLVFTSNGQSPSVFLDFHEEDNVHAIQMSNFLQQQGIGTYLSMNGSNPSENISIFETALKNARSLIIIRGKVAKEWVKERLSKAIETIMKEEYDFSAVGIYLAPHVPDQTIPIKQRFLQIQLLDDSKSAQFDPRTVAPFLKLIA